MAVVDDAVGAVTTHVADANVVSQGLAFFTGLSGSSSNQVPLMKAVDATIAAVTTHMATSAVVDYGLGFLMNVSSAGSNAVSVSSHLLSIHLPLVLRLFFL
jgi:hypothetical protein